jgi:hypothetical protein
MKQLNAWEPVCACTCSPGTGRCSPLHLPCANAVCAQTMPALHCILAHLRLTCCEPTTMHATQRRDGRLVGTLNLPFSTSGFLRVTRHHKQVVGMQLCFSNIELNFLYCKHATAWLCSGNKLAFLASPNAPRRVQYASKLSSFHSSISQVLGPGATKSNIDF